MFQECQISETFYILKRYISETWHAFMVPGHNCLKHEMFQKHDVWNVKCFWTVTFKTLKCFRLMWHSKQEILNRNMTFKIWDVSETWRSNLEMFQKCIILNIYIYFRNVTSKTCFRNLTFEKWNVSRNVTFFIWTLNRLLLRPITNFKNAQPLQYWR